MTEPLWIGLIIGLAALVQSVTGFGFALVAVSLLPLLMDLHAAVLLVIALSLVSNVVLLWHYRHSFEWSRVGHLLGAALVTIPLGVVALNYVPEQLALRLLGGLILAYVVYSWLQLSPPNLSGIRWAYAFGAASGLLTGAFNTGGPPIVVYASCNQWSPEQFKGNMPGVFCATSVVAIAAHLWDGSLTPDLWQPIAYAAPFFLGGLGLGLWLSRHIAPDRFRQAVLVLLSVMGLKLLW